MSYPESTTISDHLRKTYPKICRLKIRITILTKKFSNLGVISHRAISSIVENLQRWSVPIASDDAWRNDRRRWHHSRIRRLHLHRINAGMNDPQNDGKSEGNFRARRMIMGQDAAESRIGTTAAALGWS